MKNFLYILFFLLAHFVAHSQLIVNVENARIQSDTTGWKGDVNTSFSLTQNVQQVININATMHLQYKTTKDLYLLLANYNFLRGNEEELSNNMFYHFRYNRELNKIVRWEAFTQWQQNNLTNIDLRALFGTGPRFRIIDNPKFKLYAAALAMYEHEKDKNPREIHNDIRSDNYATFTFLPSKTISITSTTFYQPLFRQVEDYRILNQISFSLKATKHFGITTNWDFSYDSHPAAETPNVNYVISNGFSYTF
jgi:hypothetical protein